MQHMRTESPRHAKQEAQKSHAPHLREGSERLRDIVDIATGQWVLPLAFLFLELVFKTATTKGYFPSVVFIALFSLVCGEIVYLLSSLSTHEIINNRIRAGLLAVTGIAFGVVYFVFRAFKVFYDLTTVMAGAGHAAGQFGDQIVKLIFNPLGLLMVILLLAPAVCLWFVGERTLPGHQEPLFPATQATNKQRLYSLSAAVCAHVLALVLVSFTGAFGRAYTDRYSFQTSIENFGLAVSLRKEVTGLFSKSSRRVTFTKTGPSVPKVSEDEAEVSDTEGSVNYGVNSLDIDFEELADSTWDSTWAALDKYVAEQTPSSKNAMTGRFAGYNLIFISAEAFSAEAIREDTTPTLYRMATQGIQFLDYYQPASAGTTGGEYENLFGMLPTDSGASFTDTIYHMNELTMGWQLNALGYEGWAFHNNDYTYYDRNLSHNQLGYNHGYMGYYNGMEEYVQWQWPQSDLEMVRGTFDNLYGDASPFNVYYMSVSGHSLYSFDANDMSIKYEDEVADLPYSEPVRAYLACNIDLDRAMEYLIAQLEEKGIADHTVIVIGADHFPYGLDNDGALGSLPYLSELYGYNVTTSMQRDHNRLIIWSGSLEDEEPIIVDTPTSSIDILPTLLNLFGIDFDSRLLPGRDVFSDRPALVFNLLYDWKTEYGEYFGGSDRFVAAEGVEVPAGYVDQINASVANKINYMTAVLDSDYMRHVLGDPRDVDEVNAAGKERFELTGDPVTDAVARAEMRLEGEG